MFRDMKNKLFNMIQASISNEVIRGHALEVIQPSNGASTLLRLALCVICQHTAKLYTKHSVITIE